MRTNRLMVLAAVAVLILAARAVPAASAGDSASASVKMNLVTTGSLKTLGFMMPSSLVLSSEKPAALKKAPPLTAPRYGNFKFGGKSYLLLFDAPVGKDQVLYVDANANGDLTDDPRVPWSLYQGKTANNQVEYQGCFVLPLRSGTKTTPVTINAYSFTTPFNEDEASANKNVMLNYYPGYVYSGEVTLAGKTYKAALYDSHATGSFTPAPGAAGVLLCLDINGDGRFGSRSEMLDVQKPFKVAGKTWEVAGLTAGGSFKIAKSDKVVADPTPTPTPTPPPHPVGSKVLAFKATRMDGTKVNFPEDYKGKLVMLDFWATWCGPCMGEVPNLVKTYNQYHSKGIEILGISLDRANAAEQIKSVTGKNGMTWPQVYDGQFWSAEVAKLYSIHSIPAAFLVDGDSGVILAAGNELRGKNLAIAFEAAFAKKAPSAK